LNSTRHLKDKQALSALVIKNLKIYIYGLISQALSMPWKTCRHKDTKSTFNIFEE